MEVNIIKTHEGSKTPTYATDGSGAFDIYTDRNVNTHILPHRAVVFTTGLKFEIPEGYVMLLFSRSGHGFNRGLRLSNCVGVIDSDYRGEVLISLHADRDGQMVMPFERICQGFITKAERAKFIIKDKLSTTERGEKGFGSSGL